MVKEGYKEVQLLGKNLMIPVKWEIDKLNDYIDVLSGYSFSSDKFNNEENGLPLIRIRDLQESEISTYFNGDYDEKYIIDRNDILIGMDGNFYVEKWDNNKALLNQRVCRVESKSEELDQNYLYYRIKPEIDKIHRITPATTVKHLSIKDVKKTRIPFPPLPEQKKIASILSSVDKSIEKTDEVIEEIKELKKGLMQQLLTKGIGHSEFKEIRIGVKSYEIPKSWSLIKLKTITDLITKGTTPTSYGFEYKDKGINFIKVESIKRDGNLDSSLFAKISDEAHNKLNRSKLKKEDIVISIAGTLGKCSLVKESYLPANTNQALSIVRLKKSNNGKYILYYLESEYIQKYIKAISTVSAQPNLSLKQVGNFDIILSPIEEQKKIASILSSVDSKIQKEEEYKDKLKQLKKGLMQKLLTGEIRVNTEMEV